MQLRPSREYSVRHLGCPDCGGSADVVVNPRGEFVGIASVTPGRRRAS